MVAAKTKSRTGSQVTGKTDERVKGIQREVELIAPKDETLDFQGGHDDSAAVLTNRLLEPSSDLIITEGIELKEKVQVESLLYERDSYLSKYEKVFHDLVKRSKVETELDVARVMITNDSARAIAICRSSDELYKIQLVSLQTYETVNEIQIHGEYLKVNEIQQNNSGKLLNAVY